MPVRENIEFVHRAIARFNAKDLEGYLEMFDKAVVFHGLSRRLKPGVGGLREYYAALRLAFPDMRLASEDVIAEGEKVANRYTFYGTHKGDYMGIAPTSKLIISAGMVRSSPPLSRVRLPRMAEITISFAPLNVTSPAEIEPPPGRTRPAGVRIETLPAAGSEKPTVPALINTWISFPSSSSWAALPVER